MENTAPSQDQNIRANQQKDLEDRQNEPQAQTHPQSEPAPGQDEQPPTHDQNSEHGADSVRGVNEAQRDQQIVQNQRNQHRSGLR